jgi:hypothetical protein
MLDITKPATPPSVDVVENTSDRVRAVACAKP